MTEAEWLECTDPETMLIISDLALIDQLRREDMPNKMMDGLFAAALAFLALGCSVGTEDRKGDGEVDPTKVPGKVVGRVYYDGKIVPVGTITFHPELGRVVSAEIEDGEYTAERIPRGRVTLTVSTATQRMAYRTVAKQMKTGGLPPDHIKDNGPIPGMWELRDRLEKEWAKLEDMIDVPEKYADPKTSGLKFQIESGEQEIDLKLPKALLGADVSPSQEDPVPPPMIRFICPGCGKRCKFPAWRAGKPARCPRCGAHIEVPVP